MFSQFFPNTVTAVVCFALLLAMGCTLPASTSIISAREPDSGEAYNGPKVRIAIAKHEDKTLSKDFFQKNVTGEAVRDMLKTALTNTNRFSVLEELDQDASGQSKKDIPVKTIEIEGPELLIMAAITGYESEVTSVVGDSGEELLGKAWKGLEGLAGSFSQGWVTMDLRIVDARTRENIAAVAVEGKPNTINFGGIFGSSGSTDNSFKTPMGLAIRSCIKQMAEFVANQTPQRYFHVTT
jgi:curli biogenesis system outer membrane secretion channel CsgG